MQALRSSHWSLSMVSWAWDKGLTPQAIAGALGPRIAAARVGAAFEARFGGMIRAHPRGASLDRAALRAYLWAINARGGSGDSALPALLQFGAFARAPLGPRLERAAAAARVHFPVTFVHGGSHDWIPSGPSANAAAALRRHGVDAQLFLTPRAGHNLQLENPDAFVAQISARIDGRRVPVVG